MDRNEKIVATLILFSLADRIIEQKQKHHEVHEKTFKSNAPLTNSLKIDYQNVSYFLQFFTYFQLDDFEEFPLLYSLKNRRETIFRVDR